MEDENVENIQARTSNDIKTDNYDELELFSFKFKRESFIKSLNANYDDSINLVIDKALLSISSQNHAGTLQILSFLFISTVWTMVNGWYAYSVVFTGKLNEDPSARIFLNKIFQLI
jgi:hypothetical protein